MNSKKRAIKNSKGDKCERWGTTLGFDYVRPKGKGSQILIWFPASLLIALFAVFSQALSLL